MKTVQESVQESVQKLTDENEYLRKHKKNLESDNARLRFARDVLKYRLEKTERST